LAALLWAVSPAAAESPADAESGASAQAPAAQAPGGVQAPADAAPSDAQSPADAQAPAESQKAEQAPAPKFVERPISLPGPAGGEVQVPLMTFVQMRYRDMVRQAYDVSCGAAALATILKYFYGEDVTEQSVIDQIMTNADEETKEKIGKDGFSMLELKKEGERFGLVAGGFRIPEVQSLEKLQVPALTLINIRGYDHFVVIRSVENGRIYIADPAFGNRTRTLDTFGDQWKHVILVFLSKEKTGDEKFRRTTEVRAKEEQVIPFIDQISPTIAPRTGEF
jgi:predicted double-glycine peptidase